MGAALDVVSSWALQRFSLWGGWPGLKITEEQRRANVKLLVRLAFFSRRTHDALGHTAEFASARLAAEDARNAIPAQQKYTSFSERFEESLKVLSKSWLLRVQVRPRLI